MTMTRFSSLFCGLLLAALPTAAVHAEARHELLGHVPADATVVLAAADLPALAARWEGHPLYAELTGPEMQAFLAPALSGFKTAQAKGETALFDKLRDDLSGDVVIALERIEFPTTRGEDPKARAYVLAHYTGELVDLEDLYAAATKDNAMIADRPVRRLRTARHDGVDYLISETDEALQTFADTWAGAEDDPAFKAGAGEVEAAWETDFCVAVNDGLVVATNNEEGIARLLDRLDEGLEVADITTSVAWDDALDALDAAPDFFFSFQPGPAAQAYREAAAAMPPPEEANPMLPQPVQIADALALSAITHATYALAADPEAPRGLFGFRRSSDQGLASLVTLRNGALPLDLFVPTDALSGTVTLFDFGAMLTALEQVLGAASPMVAGLWQMQVQQFSQTHGIDARTALLSNFGESVITYNRLRREPLETSPLATFYAVELKDPQAFENAVLALVDQFGMRPMLSEDNVDGMTLYTWAPPTESEELAETLTMAFAFTEGYLLYDDEGGLLIREAVAVNRLGRATLWDEPHVEDALDIFRPGSCSLGYTDLAPTLRSIAEAVTGAVVASGQKNVVDPAQTPAFEAVDYAIVQAGYWDNEYFKALFHLVPTAPR